MNKKKLNIISPVYNESENLNNFYNKIKISINKLQNNYDINLILVDDGSKDNSDTIIQKLSNEDKIVKGIYFTKNFGHQNAILAGLKEFDADLYLVIDSDLQHNPELIELMLDNMMKTNSEIIQMKKSYTDYEFFLKRIFSKFFYLLFSKLTNINIEPGSSDFFLISEKVRSRLLDSKISHSFVRGFLHWTGFKKMSIDFTPSKRTSGKSNYSFLKLLEFALTGLYFYTSKLYMFIFIFSFLIMFGCLIFVIYIITSYFTGNLVENTGWSTTTILILFFGSLSLLLNSVLLFILNKIFDYSSNKPPYIKKDNKDK